MKKFELNVVNFDNEDVIATSVPATPLTPASPRIYTLDFTGEGSGTTQMFQVEGEGIKEGSKVEVEGIIYPVHYATSGGVGHFYLAKPGDPTSRAPFPEFGGIGFKADDYDGDYTLDRESGAFIKK